MNKEKVIEQKNKQSATGNLKRLADVFFDKREITAIEEIQSAIDIVNQICAKIKNKMAELSSEPVEKAPVFELPKVEVKKSSAVLPKKTFERDPNKLAAGKGAFVTGSCQLDSGVGEEEGGRIISSTK